MSNILDYIHWRGDITFKEREFNILDSAILTQISFIDYKDYVESFPTTKKTFLSKATNTYFDTVDKDKISLGLIVPHDVVTLTDYAANCRRFSAIKVSNYINKVNAKSVIQFSAICFHLPNNIIYIAFRGTDDTLIGWQEDLDMICAKPVSSQEMAVKYVNKIAKLFPESKLILGGHSKGGNLSTYSAIYCHDTIKDRIICAYNLDGPGFHSPNINVAKYKKVKNKIVRIVPKDSVVGQFFDDFAGVNIFVDSNAKGIYQHDVFSWMCDYNKFIEVESLTDNSINFDIAVTKMLEKLNEEERENLAKNVYEFITLLDKKTLVDVTNDKLKLLKVSNKLSGKHKMIFFELIVNVIKYKLL